MGLKDSECGQMGVTIMAGTLGWIMEAPAAAAYAVLPVGVETITPGGGERNFPTSLYLFIRFSSVVQFFHRAYNLLRPHCEKCDFQFEKKVEAKT